ncbi:TPA: AlpA family transcriptional regulator [Enterobacter chengduensis]|nr:AlpA family transcriptional regulator [Enterobacter chengduensis]
MNSDKLLRIRQVEEKIGFSKSWVYQQISKNRFPPGIRIGNVQVAWLESEIDAWIQQRLRLSRNA